MSEIVGFDACTGVKTASRIDPAGIVTKAAEVLVAEDANERWTHDPALAKREKGKLVTLGDGRVSEVKTRPEGAHLPSSLTIRFEAIPPLRDGETDYLRAWPRRRRARSLIKGDVA